MRELLSIISVVGLLALTYGIWRIVVWLQESAPSESNSVRGRKLLAYEDAHNLALADVERSSDQRSYPWGGIPVSAKSALGHFVAIGAPGAGKTIMVRQLLRAALQQMQDGDRCVIFDMKGDYWPFIRSHCGGGSFMAERDAALIHPFCDSTPAWDVAADASPLDDDAVCAGLLPSDATDRNPHFTAACRQLLAAVMAAFRKLGGTWTLWDLVVACSSEANLQLLGRAAKLPDIANRLASKGNEKGSVLGSVSTATNHLRIPAALWKRSLLENNRFSLTDWMEGRGPRVLVLGYDTNKQESLQPLIQALLSRIIADLLAGAEHEHAPKTWMFLDELPLAGRIDKLSHLLNTARSKGIATVIGTQSVNMLNIPALYPGTETPAILANPRNRAFLRTSDNESAQWMANQIGKREAYESGFSSGQGWSQQGGRSTQEGTDARLQERFLIHPDEFKDTPSPDEQTPLIGSFESFHGVWQGAIPPSQFPQRPGGGFPPKAPSDDLPESLQWTAADRERLRLPAATDQPTTTPERPPLQ